jgi:hypothetical protein
LNLVAPIIYSNFYSLRWDSYIVTHGPTSGARIVESLYSR